MDHKSGPGIYASHVNFGNEFDNRWFRWIVFGTCYFELIKSSIVMGLEKKDYGVNGLGKERSVIEYRIDFNAIFSANHT